MNSTCSKKADCLFSFVFQLTIEGIKSYFNRCSKRQEYLDFSVYKRIGSQ